MLVNEKIVTTDGENWWAGPKWVEQHLTLVFSLHFPVFF